MRAFLASVVLSLLPTIMFPADSPSFRGGSEHPGVYDSAPLAKFTQVKWEFATRGKVFSSPAVSGTTVFFGSTDHILYSLDLASGKQNWKFETGSGITSSPAVADGAVFFTSYDGNFYALAAATGKLRWTFQTAGEHRFTAKHIHGSQPAGETMPHPFDVFLSSPLVWHGAVYFGSGDGNVYAPSVKDGKIYFATSDTSLVYALDAKTGSTVFSVKFQGWPFFSSPAIAGNMLYAGSHSGKLITIDLATQKPAWEFAPDGQRKNGATYTKPDGTPNYEAAYSGDFNDDTVVGVQRLVTIGGIYASPVLSDDVLYIASTDGSVYALI
jgi:outer membrane protein assembly factor BamB